MTTELEVAIHRAAALPLIGEALDKARFTKSEANNEGVAQALACALVAVRCATMRIADSDLTELYGNLALDAIRAIDAGVVAYIAERN